MALIRWSKGSELYIYEDSDNQYTCCDCPLNAATSSLPDKDSLKRHILSHERIGHSIGLVGNTGDFQSYAELLAAVDNNDF